MIRENKGQIGIYTVPEIGAMCIGLSRGEDQMGLRQISRIDVDKSVIIARVYIFNLVRKKFHIRECVGRYKGLEGNEAPDETAP